jgi:hypothetical protein
LASASGCRNRRKARRVPSGDHAGCESLSNEGETQEMVGELGVYSPMIAWSPRSFSNANWGTGVGATAADRDDDDDDDDDGRGAIEPIIPWRTRNSTISSVWEGPFV